MCIAFIQSCAIRYHFSIAFSLNASWCLFEENYIYIYIYTVACYIHLCEHSINDSELNGQVELKRSKSEAFDSCDRSSDLVWLIWPWNWMHHPEGNWSSEPNYRFFGLCDLEIWYMSSKNNKAPFLYHFKLCATCRCHLWIQTSLPMAVTPENFMMIHTVTGTSPKR